MAFWPLGTTEFAAGFRPESAAASEGTADAEVDSGEEERNFTGAALLLPLVKVTLFMSVGVLFTSLVSAGDKSTQNRGLESPPNAI